MYVMILGLLPQMWCRDPGCGPWDLLSDRLLERCYHLPQLQECPWVRSRRFLSDLSSLPACGGARVLPREQETPVVFTYTCSFSLSHPLPGCRSLLPRPRFPHPFHRRSHGTSLGAEKGEGRFAGEEPSFSHPRLLTPPAPPANSSWGAWARPPGGPVRWCHRVSSGRGGGGKVAVPPAPPPPSSRSAFSAPRVTRGPRSRSSGRRSAERAPTARGRADAEARARAAPMRHTRGGAAPRPR